MAEEESHGGDEDAAEPSPALAPRAKLLPLGYFIGVQFHPGITLSAKSGYEFATCLSGYFEIDKVQISSASWAFTSEKFGLRLEVTGSQIELHVSSPADPQERYDQRYGIILSRFEEAFQPKLVLASRAMIRGLLSVEGDARKFIATRIMGINKGRLDPLNRPLHVIGMRLLFPPFKVKKNKRTTTGADWEIDVKIESWVADPTKLFIEADATWDEVKKWNDKSVSEVIARLQTVSDYIDSQLLPFIQHDPAKLDENSDESTE